MSASGRFADIARSPCGVRHEPKDDISAYSLSIRSVRLAPEEQRDDARSCEAQEGPFPACLVVATFPEYD